MRGAEAAVKDADEVEATERRATKEQEQLHTRTGKEEVRAAAEGAINDEQLDGIDEAAESSEGEADPEIVFSTPISPSRGTMAPSARSARLIRPRTPEAVEATRKRTHMLVHRIPDKPRTAPVPSTTLSISIASKHVQVAASPPAAPEVPLSTAPARLDGRPRREGKNFEYNRAMAIERGRGRGGRSGGCGRGGIT